MTTSRCEWVTKDRTVPFFDKLGQFSSGHKAGTEYASLINQLMKLAWRHLLLF